MSITRRILFISEDKIKENSLIQLNVDGKVLAQSIYDTQFSILREITGDTLYSTLLDAVAATKANPPAPLNGDIRTLLIDYIQPFLSRAVLLKLLVNLHYRVTDKGVLKYNDTQATSISSQELDYARNQLENEANAYKRILIKYITEKFKTTDCESRDEDTTSRAIGWFLPSAQSNRVISSTPLPGPPEPQDIIVTQQPENQSAAMFQSVSLTFGLSLTGFSYQWQTTLDTGQTWVDVLDLPGEYAGATTYRLFVMPTSDIVRAYRCVATDTSPQTITSEEALVYPTVIPSLQNITTGEGNNVTSNALTISGAEYLDLTTPGFTLARIGDNNLISNVSTEGVNTFVLGPKNWAVGNGVELTLQANAENETPFRFVALDDQTEVLQRVAVGAGVSPDDATNVAQMYNEASAREAGDTEVMAYADYADSIVLQNAKDFASLQAAKGVGNAEFTTDPTDEDYTTYSAVSGVGPYPFFKDASNVALSVTAADLVNAFAVQFYTTNGTVWRKRKILLPGSDNYATKLDIADYVAQDGIVGGFITKDGDVLFGLGADGEIKNPDFERLKEEVAALAGDSEYTPDPTGIVYAITDNEGAVLMGVKNNGDFVNPDFENIKSIVLGGGANTGDLSAIDTKIIFGRNLFLVENRELTLNGPAMINSRVKNTNAYNFCIQSLAAGSYPLSKVFTTNVDLSYNRFGSTARLMLRNLNVDSTLTHRLDLKVFRSLQSKVAAPVVNLIGDSLTDNTAPLIAQKFASFGLVTPKFFGIRNTGGTWSEGRAGWNVADLVYIIPRDNVAGTGYAPIPIGSEVGGSTAISATFNPFVRPAVLGDDPADVKNGYIFDYRFYLDRFRAVNRVNFENDPDVIVLNMCTNDLTNYGEIVGMANALEGYRIIIKSVRAACPNCKIGIGFPQNGGSFTTSNLRWYNAFVPFILKILELYGNRESENLYIISSHAFITDYFIFPLATGGTTNPQNGEYVAAPSESIHPEVGVPREVYAEPVFQFIHAIS